MLSCYRLCGSGFETVMNGAELIELGQAKVVVAAGTENMSAAPFVADGNAMRWGVPLGKVRYRRREPGASVVRFRMCIQGG